MATNAAPAASGAELPREQPKPGQGFFTIYKKGQGYWTRMGTALGAALVGVLIAHFLYTHVPLWVQAIMLGPGATGPEVAHASRVASYWGIGAAGGFLLAFAILVFWIMNKPTNADFLIATDSEMKKVNWTSRKDLIGSTRVVIFFMLLIALILFVIDTVFSYVFYFLDVLKFKPF